MQFVSPDEFAHHKRTKFIHAPSTRRPTDKKIIAVLKAGIDGTQVATTLITATFPCTIQGLRWVLNLTQDAGTGTAFTNWAIVILRDGLTQPTIASTDGATFYQPEQDCIVFGSNTIDNNVQSWHLEGHTKSMRKLMGGDKIVFIIVGSATNTTRCDGSIQFFCKS